MGALTDTLAADISRFIETEPRLFFNECDMQVRLCDSLMATRHYDAVMPEYRVPLAELVSRGVPGTREGRKWIMEAYFPWNNDIFVDIVVKAGTQFAGVELKYATTYLQDTLSVFDEPLLGGDEIIKNQAASDLVMYNYWKDVRRIEVIRDTFGHVAGGIALLVTNDACYWSAPRPGARYLTFSTHTGHCVGGGLLDWNGPGSPRVLESHMPFEMVGRYRCDWHPAGVAARSRRGDPFRYMLNIIQ